MPSRSRGFFRRKLSVIQQWCPLEEAELIEPFKDATGKWIYDVFGINPCLLGCVLCLSSSMDKRAARLLKPCEVFKELNVFYAEAG